MCNRVQGVSRRRIATEFGYVIEGESYDREQEKGSLFAYDHPQLPVLTAINPYQMCMMQLGYLPHEASGRPELQHKLGNLHNARTESVFEKFSFQDSIRHRRCIVPLQGFYDYQGRGKAGGRQVNQCYYISLRDGDLFYAAGVYDVCDGVTGVALLTTEANPLMQFVHNKNPRQPLHLEKKDWEQWFHAGTDAQIRELFRVVPDDNWQALEHELRPRPRPLEPGEPLSLF